jgi:hypothetical protein
VLPHLARGAQTIASAPVLTTGIPHADQAACYVRNIGTKPLEVSVQFVGSSTTAFDNCNTGPLDPGRTCVLLKDGPMLLAECRATASGSTKKLRGTAELRLSTAGGLVVWDARDLDPAASAGDVIASPSIYGSYQQSKANCFIMNVGDKPATVDAAIFDESGNALAASSNTCTGAIPAGSYCSVNVNGIPNGVAFACAATATSGSAKSLRGTFTLTDQFFGLIRRTALR